MTLYNVEIDDRAEDDIEKEAFRLGPVLGPEGALRWQAGLILKIMTLSSMPRMYVVSEDDAAASPGREVRRLLYGTGRMVYRVLYHIVEPESEGGKAWCESCAFAMQ